MKKAAFFTLGCKVNYYETEGLKYLFEQEGYRLTDFNDYADVYVINTCTVTRQSDRKSRQMIRRARRRSPEAVIAVIGCYAQVYTEDLERMPEIDILLGTQHRYRLLGLVEEVKKSGPRLEVEDFPYQPGFEDLPFYEGQQRKRAFLKIQEGCEQYCSYCIVPLARGPSRSKQPEKVMEEVHRMAEQGFKEMVITGVHLGLYGRDLPGSSLGQIIRRIEEVPGIQRIRLSSLEPLDFTRELVEAISSSRKICHHLHIPLQSGDDEVLKWMNRPYNTAEYAFLIGTLRDLIPELAVSTDIIVGFPGETEEHHRRSLKFVRKMNFSRMHVFRYSPRPGTAASRFSGQVAPSGQEKRSKEMEEAARKMAAKYRRRFLGTCQDILVEKVLESGEIEGLTRHYLRVKALAGSDASQLPGSLVRVELLEDIESQEALKGRICPSIL